MPDDTNTHDTDHGVRAISREDFLAASTASTANVYRLLRILQLRTVIMLSAGAASVVFCRSDMDVLIPALLEDASIDIDQMGVGRLLAAGTFAYYIGELVSRELVDRIGGSAVFVMMLGASAAATGCLAMSVSLGQLTTLWILSKFCQAGAWPAITQITRMWFRPSAWVRIFGLLFAPSNSGLMLANLLLGGLRFAGWHWRLVFVVAAVVLGIDIVVSALWLSNRPPPQLQALLIFDEPDTQVSSHHEQQRLGEAWTMLFSGRFLLLCCATSILCAITELMMSFLPLFLVDALSIHDGEAAQYASFFPAGMLVGALIGWAIYDKLGNTARLIYLTGCVGCTVGSLGAVRYMVAYGDSTHSLLLSATFMMGAGVAPPFLISPSMFTMKTEGHAASPILDAFRCFTTMIFQGVAGWVIQVYGWMALLNFVLFAFAYAMVAILFFSCISWCRDTKQEGSQTEIEHMNLLDQELDFDNEFLHNGEMQLRPRIAHHS